MSVGMPADLYLHEFGLHVMSVFGYSVYHVGSSLTKKRDWHDVDVRVILTDEEWAKWEFGEPGSEHLNPKWIALVMAFSELGKKMTGLPIDFQIQQMSFANEKFSCKDGCQRSWLGLALTARTQKKKDDNEGHSESDGI